MHSLLLATGYKLPATSYQLLASDDLNRSDMRPPLGVGSRDVRRLLIHRVDLAECAHRHRVAFDSAKQEMTLRRPRHGVRLLEAVGRRPAQLSCGAGDEVMDPIDG